MNDLNSLKLLFIINPSSGNNSTNWSATIEQHFKDSGHTIACVPLEDDTKPDRLKKIIADFQPDRVAAVGGDGTVKLVAESLMHSDLPLAIVPAGSANGLAKELDIPTDTSKALDIVAQGAEKAIHITIVNDQPCIHLSDLGFNAFVIKKFETGDHRGMLGYVKAAWKVLWQQPKMNVELMVNGETQAHQAAMVVIANATKYGSGARINPEGRLDDDEFEIVIVKKVSFNEILKMTLTHMPFDRDKTEVFSVKSAVIRSHRKAHFQIDGEYLGKVHEVKASLEPSSIRIIVPKDAV